MKGLSEKLARVQQGGGSHVVMALRFFKEIFSHREDARPPPDTNATATTLRVFAAGLPRSGTGSLAVALAELGYAPCHGPDALELAPVLREHYAGRATNSDILRWQEDRGYDAQGLDQLGWKLYREVAEGWPDAKVILTEHPGGAAAWAESFSSFFPDHIDYLSRPPFLYAPSLQQIMVLIRELLSYLVGDGDGAGDPRDPRFVYPARGLAAAYERHNEEVKRTVPGDRLLVFAPTQGWGPLCDFLDVDESDCPKTPYPRMTDRKMMMVVSKVAMVITSVFSSAPALVLLLGIYLVYRRRQRKHKVA